MTEPSHSSIFEKAIAVTPIDADTYSAYLDPACVLYRTAATHFARKHTATDAEPRRGQWQGRIRSPEPIAFQITFQRRTFAGPAILTVQEIKLGARVSTIHVTLSQTPDEDDAAGSEDRTKLEVKVLAYITLAPPDMEEGPGVRGAGPWTDLASGLPQGSLRGGAIDFKALAEDERDGEWRAGPPAPPSLHAAKHLKVYSPSSTLMPKTVEERAGQAVDQWAQFSPGGTPARWSNEAVVTSAGPAEKSGGAALFGRVTTDQGLMQFWYPTVTMNIDLKTRLPPGGVEWLYSRVVTRMVRGSRADLEVLILDQEGELVATSTQVALVVDPARNVKGRLQADSGKL
ncbi:thioesterase family protein [Aspergillus foveolatus]|uniref:thioesterase family protein n=1 Tax=Aspergillus foveolatus TaxID=210207 RepID=UPI003CCCB05B